MNLVLQHIETNFTRDLDEAELAKVTRQSVSSFSRSFRKHTGTTFVHYVNALRVELACQHLDQAELTVGEICLRGRLQQHLELQSPVLGDEGHAAIEVPSPQPRQEALASAA